MEKSFDLGSVLRKHQKKHKVKPMQFESVAGGVKKRMEDSLKIRKSSRLTSFDCGRNLVPASPQPVSEASDKASNRRQQLEKWKEEKLKKKKEQSANKVKPFVTGVARNPMKYVPPPPPPKPIPSSSGCVTRSQAKIQKESSKKLQSTSFAPINATFKAPQIKTLAKIPKLESAKAKKDVPKVSFKPVQSVSTSKVSTRSKAYQKIVLESKAASTKAQQKPKYPVVPLSKPLFKSKILQSSSSSEDDSHIQSSASNSDVDLTTRMVSSTEESNIQSSPEKDSSKSVQSSSSYESASDKQSPALKKRSLPAASPMKMTTPHRATRQSIHKEKLNTPRNSIPKSESSSEEKLRSPKSPVKMPMTPEQIAEEFKKISPCVTMSRGKDNARKEMKKKLEEGLLDEDASDMDSVEHFERQLASEIKRLTEICEVWDKINEQVALPESIQGMLLTAVGQARLLMSQKMQQFAGLVQRCARPEPGAALVTACDLRGFWDMLFIQVENVDMRFKELEELKARNWVERSALPGRRGRPRAPAPAPAAAPAPPAAKPAAASRLRDMIAAARRAKAQEASQAAVVPTDRTFEAGFFSVRSPARATPPATPRRQSLLKAVLSSETKKASASKNRASMAMLRASVLGRSVEVEGVEPLPQSPPPTVNLRATPGRSILKQPQSQDANKSAIKQVKVVLFNQSDTEMDTDNEDQREKSESTSTENEHDNKATEIKPLEALPTDVDISKKETITIEDEVTETEIIESETNKENTRRSRRLTRQDATETTIVPMMTRRMRKNVDTIQTTPQEQKINLEKKTPKRSTRKKVQVENESDESPRHTEEKTPRSKQTPRRSTRKTIAAEKEKEPDTPQMEQKTPITGKKSGKRSTRKSVLVEVEVNF